MDERLRSAALSGNIDALYYLIRDDADVLQRIDEMAFVDTPLHIAAAAGHTDFAMELMNLKPSFARKVNQCGFSPLHLALPNKQEKMVAHLLLIDKDLVRVKGREGHTPLHHAAKEGNVPLLSQFLDQCPNSILDLTIRKDTAVHIAAQNNHLEAFKAILRRLPTVYEVRILNLEDKDGNTVLHIAASNNQRQRNPIRGRGKTIKTKQPIVTGDMALLCFPLLGSYLTLYCQPITTQCVVPMVETCEMIKLLIKSQKVDWNKVNQSGFTALPVLEAPAGDDSRESVSMLKHAKVPPLIFLGKMLLQSRCFTEIITDILEMKTDTINTLLVVLALILSMTYQAVLSPPAGA
ncbi:Ankyrin repeat-containing protein, putative [Theobroma cacao]|uniref:Ankyrin repeat-containing protein, putative n=1 Tax=Theobroma cacao TaxID=3641 RepID=S1RTZ7_THECC|nr:Ankyrin repeat-containing protein, putative [Theobroma cacao]